MVEFYLCQLFSVASKGTLGWKGTNRGIFTLEPGWGAGLPEDLAGKLAYLPEDLAGELACRRY